MPFDNSPVTNPVIEALRAGRARVERGWCQGVLYHEGAVCALGGISRATDPALMKYDTASFQAADLLTRALDGSAGDGVWTVSVWNDAPERTQSDVLALYDRAIELAVEEAVNAPA